MKLTHPTTSYIVASKVYAPGKPVILPDDDSRIKGLRALGFVAEDVPTPDAKPPEQEIDAAKEKPLTLAEKMAAGRAAAKAKREAAKAAEEAKAAAEAEE